MFRKLTLLLTLSLLVFGSQRGEARFLAEGKASSFKPFADVLKDLYGDHWANYQLEVSYSPFDGCDPNWWSRLFAFGSYNYLYDSGFTHSGYFDNDTHIQFYNYTLGLKFVQPLPGCCYFYGVAGARYVFLRVNDNDEVVDSRRRADGLGQYYSIGFFFPLWKCIVFDLFTDVVVKRFDSSCFSGSGGEKPEGLDVSGVSLGLGVGIRF